MGCLRGGFVEKYSKEVDEGGKKMIINFKEENLNKREIV